MQQGARQKKSHSDPDNSDPDNSSRDDDPKLGGENRIRRVILGQFASMVWGGAPVPGNGVGQPKSLKEQLVGTWI